MSSKLIATDCTGPKTAEIHAKARTRDGIQTFCGLDAEYLMKNVCGLDGMEKVTCPICYDVWKNALQFGQCEFIQELFAPGP